jgi:hydroxymethylbilane synthase
MRLRIGTRESRLALIQAEKVVSSLKSLSIDFELVKYKTSGDRILDKNLYDIGGKGLFLKEIEDALIKNEIDIAVHSYKDVPGSIDARLKIGAVLEREDPRDVLLSYKAKSIKDLPKNSVVGTCSPRRRVTILDLRPDIKVVDLRGNIETRIKKFQEENLDAIILASAGLLRLELFNNEYCSYIDSDIMIPAIGQGTIAIEYKADRKDLDEIFKKINHYETWLLSNIERDFLKHLNANCNSPVACYCRRKDSQILVDFMYADYNLKFIEREKIKFAFEDYHNFVNIGESVAKKMLINK